MSFSNATADKIGLSRQSIDRAVRIHARLAPEVRKRLIGTKLSEKQSELLALARLDPAAQAKVLDLVLAEVSPARSVAAAVKHLSGAPALSDDDRQLQRLLDAWNRAGAKARAAFLEVLASDGEVSVKGRGRRRYTILAEAVV
jgi:ParB family chromosome partitioning protein